jgi:DNA polymerase III psi subunit
MKINPELSSVVNLVKKEDDYQKRSQERSDSQGKVADIISVENRAASGSRVENVEEARVLLSDVMSSMENAASTVHNLNQHRISQLIS